MEGLVTFKTTNATEALTGCFEDNTVDMVCLLRPLTNTVTLGVKTVISGLAKQSMLTLMVADVEAPSESKAVTTSDPDPIE